MSEQSLPSSIRTEREAAIAELRKAIRPGTTLHTVLRHVSRSGMSRSVSVLLSTSDGIRELDYALARALEMKLDSAHGGLRVGGCGFDAGFDIVYNLSRALYGKRGYACLGDRCPSNSHVNNPDSPRGKGVRHTDGYALKQRWL